MRAVTVTPSSFERPGGEPGIRVQWRGPELLVVEFAHAVEDDEFVAYLAELATVLTRRRRYASLCIQTGSWGLSASQRAMQIEFIRRHERELGLLCRGVAFVLPHTLPRLVLSGILLLRRLPMPHAVFDTEAAASAWLTSRSI